MNDRTEPGGDDARPRCKWNTPLTRQQRGYGAAHMRMRARVLRDEKWCRHCLRESCTLTRATVADHIKPKCFGGSDSRLNYQALCEKHSRRKSAQEGNRMRRLKARQQENTQ